MSKKEKLPSAKFLDKHSGHKSDTEDELSSFKQYTRKAKQTVDDLYRSILAEKEGDTDEPEKI